MESAEKIHQRIETSFRKQGSLTLLDAELEHVEKGKVVISCKHLKRA